MSLILSFLIIGLLAVWIARGVDPLEFSIGVLLVARAAVICSLRVSREIGPEWRRHWSPSLAQARRDTERVRPW